MQFQIHNQLTQDCHVLGAFETSRLLLHRNSLFHWFILVPETDQTDFLDLNPETRTLLLDQCAFLSSILKQHFQYPKVNFASIGNVVPQLHLHIIGRSPRDPLWPAPVWGNLKAATEYPAPEITEIIELLKRRPDFTPAA